MPSAAGRFDWQSKIFHPLPSSGGSSSGTLLGKVKFGRIFEAHATPPKRFSVFLFFALLHTPPEFFFSIHDNFDTQTIGGQIPCSLVTLQTTPAPTRNWPPVPEQLCRQVQFPTIAGRKNNKTRTIDKKNPPFSCFSAFSAGGGTFFLALPDQFLPRLLRTQLSRRTGRDFFLLRVSLLPSISYNKLLKSGTTRNYANSTPSKGFLLTVCERKLLLRRRFAQTTLLFEKYT